MSHTRFCKPSIQKIKNRYLDNKYSDVTLIIIEESNSQCELQSASDQQYSNTIKAHKIVLDLNSPYFERVLDNNGEGSMEIRLKEGEGRFFELLVSSFNDKDVIRTLKICDLTCVLELAITYASEQLVNEIADVLENLELNLESTAFGLRKLHSIELGDQSDVSEEIKSSLKLKFTSFLGKQFVPIEEKLEKHEEFLSLGYSSLFYLLQGDEPIALSENSLLAFVIEWLEYDAARQTASIIQGLLSNIRVKYLSGTFLHSGITLEHQILIKWDDFRDWVFNGIGYHVMCANEKKLRNAQLDKQVCRNADGGAHGCFTNYQSQHLCAVRWQIRMTPVEEGKRFEPSGHRHLVHDGMKFLTKAVTITPIEGDDSNFNMSLSITSSYAMVGLRFVVGILPANREYDITTKHMHSKFARSLLKLTEAIAIDSTCQVFDCWTVSKDFIDIANKDGLFVCLLPINDEEYTLRGMYFFLSCNPSNPQFNIECKHTVLDTEECDYPVQECDGGFGCYATSQLPKIHLTSYFDFSV